MTEEVNAYAESADCACSSENSGADLGCLLRDRFLCGSEFDPWVWERSQSCEFSDMDRRILRSLSIEQDDREISEKDFKELIDFQRIPALRAALSYPSVFKKTLDRKTPLQYALERKKIYSAELLMKLGAFDSSTNPLVDKLKPEKQKILQPYLEAWRNSEQELPRIIQAVAVLGDLSMLSLFFKDNPGASDKCGLLKLTLLDLAELAGQQKIAEHLKSLGRTSHSDAFWEIHRMKKEGDKPKSLLSTNEAASVPIHPFSIPRRPEGVVKRNFAKEGLVIPDFSAGDNSLFLLKSLPLTQKAKDFLHDQKRGLSENELREKYGTELFESCRELFVRLNIG